MEAFVDRLALDSSAPVVQEWGGPIGFALAARDPSRIEKWWT